MRRRRTPTRRRPRRGRCCRFLLRYPDADVAAARDELAGEVAALPDGPVRDGARALPRRLDGRSDGAARRATSRPSTCAAAPACTSPTTRTATRASAAWRCCASRSSTAPPGCRWTSAELPDHLPVMLEFAALAPAGHGEALLAEHRPAIELLRLSLHDLGSPYAHVLDAIAAVPAARCSVDRARRGRAARARGPARGGGRPRAVRAAGGDADGSARMSAGEILLWIILPYAAMATFVVGHWWRYRTDQFGWTSGSTQLFEQQDPRLGQPGVPLRRARRRRRPRHRADDPEVVHRGGRHVRAAPTAGSRRSPAPSPARSASSGSSGSSTGGPPTSASAARPRGPTCSSTSCSSS